MKSLKSLITLFPAFAAIIIFFASYQNYIYYSFFGVNIMHFITLDEILVLFFDELFIVAGFVLYIFMLYFVKNVSRLSKKDEFYSNSKNKIDKFFKILYQSRGLFISGFGSVLVLFVGVSVILSLGHIKTLKFLLYIMYLLLTSYLIAYYFLHKSKKNRKFYLTGFISLLLIIFLPFALTYSLSAAQFYSKTKRDSSEKVFMHLKNKTIHTDENLHFIGRTKNFTFIYDEVEKSSSVIRNEDIVKMVFEKKNK